MGYTDDDGFQILKGASRTAERDFSAQTDGNGELVVTVSDLISADTVKGVEITDSGGTTIDPAAQYDNNANTAVDAWADSSQVNSSLGDNEVAITAVSDLNGTALANTSITGTVVVEGY